MLIFSVIFNGFLETRLVLGGKGRSALTMAEKTADWMDFWVANRFRVEVGLKPSVLPQLHLMKGLRVVTKKLE